MPFMPQILPAAALLGAVGLGCTTIAGSTSDRPTDQPLACAVNILPDGDGLRVIATARSRDAISGTYDLSIENSGRSGSATIRQGGEIDLRPGRTETLGEARMMGRVRDIEARLTLKAGGVTYRCTGTDQTIDL